MNIGLRYGASRPSKPWDGGALASHQASCSMAHVWTTVCKLRCSIEYNECTGHTTYGQESSWAARTTGPCRRCWAKSRETRQGRKKQKRRHL